MRLAYILFFVSVFLSSCTIVKSSKHYTIGTECLEKGDHEGAIENLKKAVELDPESARNQTNLSMAYLNSGNNYLAWVHTRKALFAKYPDKCAKQNFLSFCKVMIVAKGLDQPGVCLDSIREALGEPDDRCSLKFLGTEVLTTVFQYGLCLMYFEDEKLVCCKLINVE